VDLATVVLILRYLITAGGGFMIAHGMATDNGVQQALGIIPMIAPIVLGWITHLQQKTAVVQAAATGVAAQPTLTAPLTPTPEAKAAVAAKAP
jgi:hypothetical protein